MDTFVEHIVLESFSQHVFIRFLLVFFVVLKVAILVLRDLPYLFEETILYRQIKRLNMLKDLTKEESKLNQFISDISESEVFRIITGIKASNNHADALMDIYITGIVSKTELKNISRYIVPTASHKKIEFRVKVFDKIIFVYSSIAALFFLVIGVYIVVVASIRASQGLVYFIAGMIWVSVISIIIKIVGKDFATYLVLMRVREKLKSIEKLHDSDQIIGFKFFSILVEKIGFL